MAYTTVANGQVVEANHHNEVVKSLNGTSGYGQPISLTQLSDASNYAVDVRNLDPTNGYVARFRDEANNLIASLTRAAVTLGKALSLTQTWNAAGTAFKGILLNVTNTASHEDSRLIDLQVGGASKFSVDVDGNLVTGAVATAALEDGAVTAAKIADRLRRHYVPFAHSWEESTNNPVDGYQWGAELTSPDDFTGATTVLPSDVQTAGSGNVLKLRVVASTHVAPAASTFTADIAVEVKYGQNLQHTFSDTATLSFQNTDPTEMRVVTINQEVADLSAESIVSEGTPILIIITNNEDIPLPAFGLFVAGAILEYTADS